MRLYPVFRLRSVAVVTQDGFWRFAALGTVTKQSAFRVAALQGVYTARRHRFSNAAAQAYGLHRFACPAGVTARGLHRVNALPADVDEGVSEYDLAWKFGIGTLVREIGILWNGSYKSLGEAPGLLEFTHNESAPNGWSISIADPTGEYHPRKAGGEWEDWMDDAAYDEDGNIVKTLIARLTWGGAEYLFIGVPKTFGHVRNRQTQRIEFQWGGLGVSSRLFRRAQTLDSIRSTRSATSAPMLRTVLKQIADSQRTKSDFSRVDNQPVRIMHMQNGRPGDWMQQLLEAAPFAEWREEGETVVGFQPTVKSSPDWVYSKDTCTESESLDANADDMVNLVEVRSAREAGQKPEGMPPVLLNEFNRYRVPFNPPLSGAQWRWVRPNPVGDIPLIIYRRQGNVIAVRLAANSRGLAQYPDSILGAPIYRADEAEIYWMAGIGVPIPENGGPTSAIAEIEFIGTQGDNPDSEFGSEIDEVTGVTRRNDASIEKYGENPIELSPNPLLTTRAQMERYGDRYLARASRIEPKTLTVPLNLLMQVGDTVEIRDAILGTQESRYVSQVGHKVSNDPIQRLTGTTFVSWIYQMPPNGL